MDEKSVRSRSLSLAPKLSLAPGGGASSKTENKVVINVGGIRYETYKSTLRNIPDSRSFLFFSSSQENIFPILDHFSQL